MSNILENIEVRTEYEAAFSQGAALELKTKKINSVEHALIPPGSSLHSFESLMPAPQRIQAHPSFYDVDGFAEYVAEFKEAGSRVFVDDDKYRFTTIFDCHHKGKPAWGDHSASYRVELSREWSRFAACNNRKMAGADFAEFVEDNLAYIVAPITGADLFAMAQSFKIKLKGDVEVDETVSRGLKHLVIHDDSTVQGKNLEGKALEFPEKLTLSMRVFKNSGAYDIEVFLRYRIVDKKLVFWITIPDPEAIIEAAFDQVIQEVRDKTGLPTLKGSFVGPDHRK